MKTNHQDVQEFHDRFGLDRDRPPGPQFLSAELQRFRLAFMLEELAEYASAVGMREASEELHGISRNVLNAALTEDDDIDMVVAFDSLIDLSVVTHGTADFHGFPWQEGWSIVHERNMAKRRAKPDGSDSKRGSPFDVIKPEGWYPPEAQLKALLGL